MNHELSTLDGFFERFFVKQICLYEFQLAELISKCVSERLDLLFVLGVTDSSSDTVGAVLKESLADLGADESADSCDYY